MVGESSSSETDISDVFMGQPKENVDSDLVIADVVSVFNCLVKYAVGQARNLYSYSYTPIWLTCCPPSYFPSRPGVVFSGVLLK